MIFHLATQPDFAMNLIGLGLVCHWRLFNSMAIDFLASQVKGGWPAIIEEITN